MICVYNVFQFVQKKTDLDIIDFSQTTIKDYLKLSLFGTGDGLQRNWHGDFLVLLRKRI